MTQDVPNLEPIPYMVACYRSVIDTPLGVGRKVGPRVGRVGFRRQYVEFPTVPTQHTAPVSYTHSGTIFSRIISLP
jgi:hypothetical protein